MLRSSSSLVEVANKLRNFIILVANVLIAGGTGFLGRAVTKYLSKNGFCCTVLSRTSSEYHRHNGVDYRCCDVTNLAEVQKCLKHDVFKYVVNLSGKINHESIFERGADVIDDHFLSVVNLLRALNRSNMQRFVQIGSSDEYGSHCAPQVETMLGNPFSTYSFAKLSATNLLCMLHQTEGFPATVLRPFLIYGEAQDLRRFVPSTIVGCLKGLTVKLSEGEQLRDFCHVDDFCRAVVLALENNAANGRIFNIGSGTPTAVRDLALSIQSFVGRGKLEFGSVPYRVGENFELFADVSTSSKVLGWSSKIGLEEGMARTIRYYESYI